MKVFAVGVTQSTGISKKDGNAAYLITTLRVLSDFIPYSNKTAEHKPGQPNHQVAGFGKDLSEIPVAPEIFTSFNKVSFPCSLELVTDSEFRNGRMQTVVTNFKVAE